MRNQLLNTLPADIWNHILPFTYKCQPLPLLEQIQKFKRYHLKYCRSPYRSWAWDYSLLSPNPYYTLEYTPVEIDWSLLGLNP